MNRNIAVDPELLERAVAVSGKRSRNGILTLALEEFIARREEDRLRAAFGPAERSATIDFEQRRSA